MPNFITRLFSNGATKLVEGIGNVLDELITSKDEKLAAELKIKELIAKHEVEMETEITSRWSSDMKCCPPNEELKLALAHAADHMMSAGPRMIGPARSDKPVFVFIDGAC